MKEQNLNNNTFYPPETPCRLATFYILHSILYFRNAYLFDRSLDDLGLDDWSILENIGKKDG